MNGLRPLPIEGNVTAQKLSSLYTLFWNLCAGWNKVCFQAPQITHILSHSKIELEVAALGDLDALAAVIDGHYVVCLNRRLCPRITQHMLTHKLWSAVADGLSSRARFAFLHEVAHLILHSEDTRVWRERNCGILSGVRWVAESSTANWRDPHLAPTDEAQKAAELLREVEADFCALVAMIPDRLLFRMDEDGCLNAERVLGLMTKGESADSSAWGNDALALASYRIKIYRQFSYLFWSISKVLPLEDIGRAEKFYDVLTIEMDCVDKWVAGALREKSRECTLDHILVGHPRFRHGDLSTLRALDAGVQHPFGFLPGTGAVARNFQEWILTDRISITPPV